MPLSPLLRRARQGDPTAIATLINRTLQPKGLFTQAHRQDDCLHLLLQGHQVPSQQTLMPYLQRSFVQLAATGIWRVQVYGCVCGHRGAVWMDAFDLSPFPDLATLEAEAGQFPKRDRPLEPSSARSDDVESHYSNSHPLNSRSQRTSAVPLALNRVTQEWFLATLLAGLLGVAFTSPFHLLERVWPSVSAYLWILCAGLLVSGMQAYVLSRWIDHGGLWVLATSGGLALGNWLSYSDAEMPLINPVFLRLLGIWPHVFVLVILLQWLVLRQSVPQGQWWIAANVLGLLPYSIFNGMLITATPFVVGLSRHVPVLNAPWSLTQQLAPIAGMLSFNLLTSAVMGWLLRDRVSQWRSRNRLHNQA